MEVWIPEPSRSNYVNIRKGTSTDTDIVSRVGSDNDCFYEYNTELVNTNWREIVQHGKDGERVSGYVHNAYIDIQEIELQKVSSGTDGSEDDPVEENDNMVFVDFDFGGKPTVYIRKSHAVLLGNLMQQLGTYVADIKNHTE